jgi:hypothetical protein
MKSIFVCFCISIKTVRGQFIVTPTFHLWGTEMSMTLCNTQKTNTLIISNSSLPTVSLNTTGSTGKSQSSAAPHH